MSLIRKIRKSLGIKPKTVKLEPMPTLYSDSPQSTVPTECIGDDEEPSPVEIRFFPCREDMLAESEEILDLMAFFGDEKQVKYWCASDLASNLTHAYDDTISDAMAHMDDNTLLFYLHHLRYLVGRPL